MRRSGVRVPKLAQIEACLIDRLLCLNLNIIFYETSYCNLLCIDVLWGSTMAHSKKAVFRHKGCIGGR